jgi:hypothetical protein
VEQNFTDLALAQRSSPHVTEIHRPTRSSTCGTVLTGPGYTYPKHQNPMTSESSHIKYNKQLKTTQQRANHIKSQHALALKLDVQL